jgi:PAS domain S-box-containing protein
MTPIQSQIRVLYVDDDTEFANVAATFLDRKDNQMTIETLCNPQDVLASITHEPPDCIVSDYEMPQVDGLSLLESVRQEYPNLPFILFTSRGTEAVASEAISLDVTDYVQKDMKEGTYDLLANRIKNAVESYRQRQHAIQLRHRFEVVLDTIEAAVFLKEPDGEYLLMNEAYKQRVRIDASTELHELDYNDLFSSDVAARYRSDDQRVVETQDTIEIEESDPDAEQVWLTRKSPVFDDADNVIAICGVSTDITAQKRRQRALEQYEEYLSHSPEIMAILDQTGEVVYQSPMKQDLYSFDLPRVSGENVVDYVHPDDKDRFLQDFNRVLSNPEKLVTTEYRTATTDGNWVWLENHAFNYLDQDPINGILISAREINDRKDQEQSLEQYNETLEQLHETTPALLEATDMETAATRVIERFETIFEYDIAGVWVSTEDQQALEPIALSDRGEELISEPPTYTADVQSISWEAYESQQLRYIRDVSTHQQRANPDTPIRSEVIVPLGKHGLLNIGSVERDAYAEYEIDLIELWAKTLTVIFARITQIQILRDREEELTRERDRLNEFTRAVTHDLQNPLNVASGYTELAAQECDSTHLTKISQALSRMEELIEDISVLAQQGQVVGETNPVDIDAVVSQCWERVETADATLTIESTATIQADESRLAEVLENLLLNAIEHCDEPVEIYVGIAEEENGFYIADNGQGIADEYLPHVFESGYTTVQNNTGFGLSIARRICEAHGWELTVTESAHGGARFDITGVEMSEC